MSKITAKIVNLLNSIINETRKDIIKIGGIMALKNKYGVEAHFKWRIIYHLENLLPDDLFQSTEVKIYKIYSYDLAVYRDSLPILIVF